jgi:integrase
MTKRNKAGDPVAWRVRWRENGKQRYRQFRNEADAVEFKKTVEPSEYDRMVADAKKRGEYVDILGEQDRFGRPIGTPEAGDERWSFVRYATRMVETQDLGPSSRFTYLRSLRLHFEGTEIGKADVRYVTPQQIEEWWVGVKTGRADAYRMLSKIFRRAVKVGDRQDNPLDRTEIKKPQRVKELDFDPLTSEQIERLAQAATANTKGFRGKVGEMTRERDRLMILVMGYAGLRAGETGGLRVQDLVKTPKGRCQFRVRQQVVRDTPKEEPRISGLKTPAARRTIPVPCSLWEELQTFVKVYGPAKDGRLFHGPNGELRDNVLTRNMVKRAGKRLGMDVHPHLLRHSAVSILIHRGANPKQVQAFVGHEDVTLTLRIYAHLFDESGDEIGDMMEEEREQYRNGK